MRSGRQDGGVSGEGSDRRRRKQWDKGVSKDLRSGLEEDSVRGGRQEWMLLSETLQSSPKSYLPMGRR